MFPLEKFYRGEIFTKTSDQPNQQKKEIPIHPHWVCLCVVTQRRRLLLMSVIKEKYEKIMIFYLNVKMTKQYVHSSPHSLCFFFGQSNFCPVDILKQLCKRCFQLQLKYFVKIVVLIYFQIFFVFNQILQSAKVLGIKYRRFFFSFKISFCFFFIEFFFNVLCIFFVNSII